MKSPTPTAGATHGGVAGPRDRIHCVRVSRYAPHPQWPRGAHEEEEEGGGGDRERERRLRCAAMRRRAT